MGEFRMPVLGADMVAGTMVEWKKRPGDRVARGEIIAEVETDKGAIEIEVFEDGVLERICVEPGQKVPVGTVLAVIDGGAAAAEGPSVPAPPAPQPQAKEAVSPVPAPVTAAEPGAPPRRRASPIARRLAADLGLALESITGSGPGGVIVEADVRAAAASAPAPADREGDRAHRMRRAIAAAMTRSKREIPHFYLLSTVDFAPATEWLRGENASRTPAERILSAVLLLKATALALLEFPELNARWENDRLTPADAVHIGVATTLRGGGLVIPALHHVNRKTLPELMQELREVVERARTGRLRGSDLTDGTITVSSLGDRGADAVLPVIYPPQTAIVGFGSVVERPWVVGGAVLARPVITVTLAGDHRASDGHRGAHFLETVNRLLQVPASL